MPVMKREGILKWEVGIWKSEVVKERMWEGERVRSGKWECGSGNFEVGSGTRRRPKRAGLCRGRDAEVGKRSA